VWHWTCCTSQTVFTLTDAYALCVFHSLWWRLRCRLALEKAFMSILLPLHSTILTAIFRLFMGFPFTHLAYFSPCILTFILSCPSSCITSCYFFLDVVPAGLTLTVHCIKAYWSGTNFALNCMSCVTTPNQVKFCARHYCVILLGLILADICRHIRWTGWTLTVDLSQHR